MRDWSEIAEGEVSKIAEATAQWREEKGFVTGWGNFGEKLMLILTEVAEASEAAHKANKALGKLLAPISLGDLTDKFECLSAHAENYVEEWVDVMVRVFDLVGSCGIAVPVRKSILTDVQGRAPLAEVFGDRVDIHAVEVLQLTSSAMEVLRDIELESTGEGMQPVNPDPAKLEELGICFGGVLLTARWAISGLGENWRKHYADKMVKNEGRPSRHGRQR